jgi:nucleotide-binding universal stress UspA family protein
MGGSKVSEQVLPYVRYMARAFDSEVILLSVPEDLESPNQLEFITHYLEDVAAALNGDGLKAKFVVDGTDPARMITKLAEVESVDLIMMATHGRGLMDRLMLGSVADTVIKRARCPVFLVPVHD